MQGWSEDKGRGQRLEQAAKVCDPQTCCPAPQEVAEATGGGMGSKRARGLQQGHLTWASAQAQQGDTCHGARVTCRRLCSWTEPRHPGTVPQEVHMGPPLSPHLHHHGESIFPLKAAGHLKSAVLSRPLLQISASAKGQGCYEHVPRAMAPRRSHVLGCSLGNRPVTFPHW